MSSNNSISVTLGCDPQAVVTISETDTGTLFIIVASADPTMPVDLDGVFFNLSDDSTLDSLNFFPDANTGSIYSPVTGVQAAVDAVDTLANGAQVADQFDVGIQFGTTASSTQGEVTQANFTLFSDNGPMSISDLDVSSFTTVVDSDGGNGQVLTSGDTPDADPVLVVKEALFDNFNGIHNAEDSSIVEGHTNWVAAWDKLVTNSHNEGVLALQEVSTDGPVTLSFDANVHNTQLFENSGLAADSLRVEVNIDGQGWVLLDEFQVNDAGTAIVGSETGQTFGNYASNITYEGGILDTAEESAQFRFISDVTASDEYIKLDNVSVNVSEEVDGEVGSVETTLLVEDFNDIYDPDDSAAIAHDGRWDVRGDELVTDGCNDGVLQTAAVAADGNVELSFDARVGDASLFEASGYYADNLLLQVRAEDGNWQTLDNFVVNHAGTALVGSNTGNEITESGSTLTYSGGALDDINGNVEFRIYSNLSASNEQVFFDNLTVTQTADEVVADDDTVVVDFEGLNSGDVISDQFAGVTISAQRNGDHPDSQNDAMIFDTDNVTGHDYDLGYNGVGNAMIISEDNDSSDADDNWHGGTMTFDFDAPSEVVSINMLDVEEHGGTIDLFDADGGLINTVDIPASGNNSQQEVIINADNVASMNVNLVGSGAVDDLTFIPPSDAADDGKGGQYDVEYIAGIPVLQPVAEDQLKAEINVVDDAEDDLII
ncbi:hypothetical protein ABMC88_13920 [Sulfitobacter sp. HNIBRBA2951]|uniref:hypothetical protein n=1 Tax=Sulfitobacter aquimarinus TaxID=3158557 RepID=UPI0032DFF8D7